MNERHLTFAFAVPCHNEAQNLPQLLPLLDQTRVRGRAAERFVVVSDVSKDGTDEVVRRFAQTTPIPVRLIANGKRHGKSAAINQALRELRDVDVIVMISGDVLPEGDCIARLVEAFEDPGVGVAGGRQVPIGPRGNVAAEITRFMWALHHVIATKHPKTTEVTVFRNVIQQIDRRSLVDEAALEVAIQREGYVVRYVPEARILSPTPLRLSDYIKQRTTVTLGYLRLRRTDGHVMDTQKLGERLRAIRLVWKTKEFPASTVVIATGVELVVRVLAWIQLLARVHRHGVWGRSESTKRCLDLTPETPAALSRTERQISV